MGGLQSGSLAPDGTPSIRHVRALGSVPGACQGSSLSRVRWRTCVADPLAWRHPRNGVSWRTTVRWTPRVAEAGLSKGFTFHDLRYSGNHVAAVSGASTKVLMQRMGQSTMRATLIYRHATDDRAREIADRLNEPVQSQIKAMAAGTPDDGEVAAGLLIPTGWGTRLEPHPHMTKGPGLRIPAAGACRVRTGDENRTRVASWKIDRTHAHRLALSLSWCLPIDPI